MTRINTHRNKLVETRVSRGTHYVECFGNDDLRVNADFISSVSHQRWGNLQTESAGRESRRALTW